MLIGLPGSGKSTACGNIVGPHTYDEPWSTGATIAALGPLDGPVRGIDGVVPARAAGIPGAISATALRWWLDHAPRQRVVIDNLRFDLEALHGYRVRSFHVDVPIGAALERRAKRGSKAMGSGWWSRCAHEVAWRAQVTKAERVDGLEPAASVADVILNSLGWL